jgi:DNA-binding NarL/FixJ family response regulator
MTSAKASTVADLRTANGAAPGRLRIGPSTHAGVLRVAVAHRSPVARAALRAALAGRSDITVVGEAASGEEVVDLATFFRPHVVAMDVRLPGLGCVDATWRTRAACGAAVMLLSGDEPDSRVLAALRAGAAGVMRTDSAPSDLVHALRLIGRGRPLRPPRRFRGRHPREEAMQRPKVTEIRRGSAHGRIVGPKLAAVPSSVRHAGGQRWNSAT